MAGTRHTTSTPLKHVLNTHRPSRAWKCSNNTTQLQYRTAILAAQKHNTTAFVDGYIKYWPITFIQPLLPMHSILLFPSSTIKGDTTQCCDALSAQLGPTLPHVLLSHDKHVSQLVTNNRPFHFLYTLLLRLLPTA